MPEGKSLNSNYLILIGLGVLVCLLILTIISLLDLRRDMRQTKPASLASLAAATPSISVCPYCGTKGIPQCFSCGSPMHWNTGQGTYFCPHCRQHQPSHCPYCATPMQPDQRITKAGPPSSNQPWNLVR